MKMGVGIVLKTFFPKKRKVAVLDKDDGMMEYIPDTENICQGALIHYYHTDGKNSFIRGIENVGMPLLLAKRDLLFFHHVLEMCYFFMPIGVTNSDIFALVEFLYSIDSSRLNPSIKKVFMMKLFAMFGVYPEHKKFHTAYYYQLAALPTSSLLEQNLDAQALEDMDQWLRLCVASHPYNEQFKTVHFLDEGKNE